MACHLSVFMLLVLCVLSTSRAWNVSIDCGAAGSYIDSNSIEWIGDESLIQSGDTYDVKHNYRPFQTLRAFSTGKRNCYSINATKGDQVLVRATFYYGNYDSKSLAPTFELQFDGNLWATVETQIDVQVTHEAIYFVGGNVISVCVAQTRPNQFPFISALEVRSLPGNMYAHADKNSALFTQRRLAFGARAIVRHPYDRYDRIWTPANTLGLFFVTRSNSTPIVVSTSDSPPDAVLEAALISNRTEFGIVFGSLSYDEVPVYMNMYFAEVEQAVQNRSFQVFKDDILLSPEPIVPSYENATELPIFNITAYSGTVFNLRATPDSKLPPIINALELFIVSDPLTKGTDSSDVDGLAALKAVFNVLQNWTGDPCLPTKYKWDWVNCSTDISPRVIALNLNEFGLSGPLPDFSSMDALQYINLQNNSLNGTIPNFLGYFPSLKALNLANNNFSGLVPPSVSSNTNINLMVTGNPNLCVSESCKSSFSGEKRNLPTVFAASIPTFIIYWVLCWI